MAQQTHFGLFTVNADGQFIPASVDAIIATARTCLDSMFVREAALGSPDAAKDYLSLKLGQLEHEVFAVVFLDAQNRVIECREMFRGTLTQTSVYPREVVKASLQLNAAALILAHNHPSGVAEPSRADEYLTQTLKTALAMIDVRVIDHMVVAGGRVVSFAERGLL